MAAANTSSAWSSSSQTVRFGFEAAVTHPHGAPSRKQLLFTQLPQTRTAHCRCTQPILQQRRAYRARWPTWRHRKGYRPTRTRHRVADSGFQRPPELRHHRCS